MKEKCVIYARYSSEKQTEQSIEGQIHVCMDYAAKNNLEIIDTYIDRAKTGRNDNREAFQRMLKDSASHTFSCIHVYALDRFSRNRYDSAIHKATLKKNGIRLISATQPISNSPEGILLESLLEGLAEYYSVELAQKVARGRKESVIKGQYVGGYVPFGYKIENKKYVINETEAQIVQLIYKLYLSGMSYKEIVDYLRQENVYTHRNKPFASNAVITILKNQTYTGILKCGEIINEKAIPPIIDKNTFSEVQLKMSIHTKSCSKSPENFLLTGKIFCAECGENIIGDSGTSRTGKTYYYYCCSNRKRARGCKLPKVSKEKLEDFIYKLAKHQLAMPQFSNILIEKLSKMIAENDNTKKIENCKKEITSINKKMDNLLEAVQNGFFNEKLKEQNDNLLSQKRELETKISQLENDPFIGKTTEDIRNYVINKYAKANKETLLKTLVNKIILSKDKITIIFNIYGQNRHLLQAYLPVKYSGSTKSNVVGVIGLEPMTLCL